MQTETVQKCFNCRGTESLDYFQINDFDGVCHTSTKTKLCEKCAEKHVHFTEAGLFLKLHDGLYYHTGWGAYEKIRSQLHLDRIFNKDYYELLNHIR